MSIEILRYITESPPQEYGGFAPQTVEAAKWAIAEIERLEKTTERYRNCIGDIMSGIYEGKATVDDIAEVVRTYAYPGEIAVIDLNAAAAEKELKGSEK